MHVYTQRPIAKASANPKTYYCVYPILYSHGIVGMWLTPDNNGYLNWWLFPESTSPLDFSQWLWISFPVRMLIQPEIAIWVVYTSTFTRFFLSRLFPFNLACLHPIRRVEKKNNKITFIQSIMYPKNVMIWHETNSSRQLYLTDL